MTSGRAPGSWQNGSSESFDLRGDNAYSGHFLLCAQLNWPTIALVITSRRVIARTSRRTRRSMFSIARLYPTRRTCLTVYAPDISYVYDTNRLKPCEGGPFRGI